MAATLWPTNDSSPAWRLRKTRREIASSSFTAPMLTDDPFVPGRHISGFKTGPLGMGHAVLHTDNVDALLPFYRDTLGFRLSDYGLHPIPLYFFHVNGRHHSFAVLGTGQTGFHHFMVEYTNLDDVGQGYDIAQQSEDAIAYTLGRHTNDWMTSFYTQYAVRLLRRDRVGRQDHRPGQDWQIQVMEDGPSFWGHDRPQSAGRAAPGVPQAQARYGQERSASAAAHRLSVALGCAERRHTGLNARMPRHRQPPYDVAIVGLGPTGATLAGLLGLCGLQVAVLERDRAILDLPRAVHFDGEVMRIFQTIGIADRVAAVSRINAGMRFVRSRRKAPARLAAAAAGRSAGLVPQLPLPPA